MGKFVKLHYNGARGWSASIKQVLDYYRITQEFSDWIKVTDPETGETNGQIIIQTYDDKTAHRLGYKTLQKGTDEETGLDYEYFEENKSKNQKGAELSGSEPMPFPIILFVESVNITRDILLDQSNLVRSSRVTEYDSDNKGRIFVSTSLDGFIRSENLFLINNPDEGHRNRFRGNQIGYNPQEYEYVVKEKPNLKVWLWSKSMNELKAFDKNSLIDITPFVTSVNTNTSQSGGSWSLNVIPIKGDILCDVGKPSSKWFINRNSYYVWEHNGEKNFVFKDEINRLNASKYEANLEHKTSGTRFQSSKLDGVSITDNFTTEDLWRGDDGINEWIRTKSFFTNIVSENDLIFISFEDNSKPSTYSDDFFLSVDEIQNKRWTMIGLVDNNSTSFNTEGTEISISITGRDLMKLLIEDGSFFFQKSYSNPDESETAFNNVKLPRQGDAANTSNKTVQNGDAERGINRLVFSGMIETLFNQSARNVGFLMNLLLSRLANIEICPSQVFESYGERKTKFQVEIFEEDKSVK